MSTDTEAICKGSEGFSGHGVSTRTAERETEEGKGRSRGCIQSQAVNVMLRVMGLIPQGL